MLLIFGMSKTNSGDSKAQTTATCTACGAAVAVRPGDGGEPHSRLEPGAACEGHVPEAPALLRELLESLRAELSEKSTENRWRARANRLRWALVDIALGNVADPAKRASEALAHEREINDQERADAARGKV